MHHTHRFIGRLALAFGTMLAMIMGVLPAPEAAQAQGRQCFTETSQCIEGRFLEYWQQSGSLAVFGFPIGPAQNETNRDTGKVYLTQWFERNRFELHPENARPYDVLLGRLGEDTLIKQGRDWRKEYVQPTSIGGDCEAPSTDGKMFTLCPPFRSYYWSHGVQFDGSAEISTAESLALFGLPLTQPKMETNSSGDTVMTQWFERARMEYHPNNPEPYKVLLGLLGNEIKGRTNPTQPLKPVVTYVRADGTIAETNGGTPQVVDRVYGRGKVLDAVREGNSLVVLTEGGIMRAPIGTEDQTIAEFSRGNASFGALVAPRGTTKILYNYARQPSDPDAIFFEGVAGVIDSTTARKVHDAENPMWVLGTSADDQNMLLVNVGGDPSWAGVEVFSLADGRMVTRLPYSGDGPPALAPNRMMVATPQTRDGRPDTVVLFDMNNQTGAPRNARIGRDGWFISQLAWSNDSTAVYALAYPSVDNPKGELWRIDVATLKSTLVAGNLPLDARVVGTSDASTLVLQSIDRAVLMNLTNGATTSYPIPEDAIVAHVR